MAKRAYNLLELLIVVVILGILARMGYVQYTSSIEKGRAAEAYSVLSDISGAEKVFFTENNAFTAGITNLHNYTAVPTSANFVFSVPSTNSVNGYVQAARVSALAGRLSYWMCLSSGRRGSCNGNSGACRNCP